MKKAVISALSCLFLTLVFPAAAQAQELTVGGQVVGIQIRTEGVLVAGLAEVETAGGPRSPATDAGIHAGDLILEADGQKLSGAGALIRAVAAADGAPLELTVRREEKTLRITVQPQQSAEGQWLMGMWLGCPASAPSPSATRPAASTARWATASATGRPRCSCR